MSKHARFIGAVAGALMLLATACGGTDAETTQKKTDRRHAIEEHLRSLEECLNSAGWEPEVQMWDGGIVDPEGLTPDQASAYAAALDTCLKNHPAPEDPPMTRARAEAFYDALVETAECLEDNGYTAPKPPSKEQSVESMLANSPYIVPNFDPFEIAGADKEPMTVCPAPIFGE